MSEKTPWWNHPWLLASVPALIVGVILWPKGQESAALAGATTVVQRVSAIVGRSVALPAWELSAWIAGPMVLAWTLRGRLQRGVSAPVPARRARLDGLTAPQVRVLAAYAIFHNRGDLHLQRDDLARATEIGFLELDSINEELVDRGLVEAPFGVSNILSLSLEGRKYAMDADLLGKVRRAASAGE